MNFSPEKIDGHSSWHQFLNWWMNLDWWKYILVTNGIMIGLGILLTPIMVLAGLDIESDIGGPDFGDMGPLIIVLTAVVLAPLMETAFFQLPILFLKKYTYLWPLILLSSSFFAIAHMGYSVWYALIVFPMGLVLALTIVYYKGSKVNGFWMTVLVHAFRNGLAMIPFFLMPEA